MKVLSYNVRGLGGGEKRAEVRRLIGEKHPMVVCIQETKLSVVNAQVIKAVWGDISCGYSNNLRLELRVAWLRCGTRLLLTLGLL
jgi:exonuclease III